MVKMCAYFQYNSRQLLIYIIRVIVKQALILYHVLSHCVKMIGMHFDHCENTSTIDNRFLLFGNGLFNVIDFPISQTL